jgi:hypothetical protein
MSLPRSVAEILREHVTLEIECMDRMYLNVYIPQLQREGGVASFFRFHRGHPFASSVLMDPISKAFIGTMERFAKEQKIPVVTFRKGERKDDIAAGYRKRWGREEGVVLIGKAQEKTPVFRTERRRNEKTGVTYPWLVRSTAMVNHFYVYIVDRDFGPFFLKFCTYFPYNAKLCLNGHEYVKRQLDQKRIGYQALDNGILSCQDPQRVQAICDGLSAEKIDALLRKWLRRLPHPFTLQDRKAGYCYDLSILQAEFSLTQVLDRPLTGRIFFEEVIRENLDIGRPDRVQLLFNRRLTRRTPGRFHAGAHRRRCAIVTPGVQELSHQAVPQRRPCFAHGNHHQQHTRLRHRQATQEPSRFTEDRLCSQPTPARRPKGLPRLLDWRRRVRSSGPSRGGRRATGLGFAVRRCACTGSVHGAGVIWSSAAGFHQPGNPIVARSTAGLRPSPLPRRQNDL